MANDPRDESAAERDTPAAGSARAASIPAPEVVLR
jgi:hypothetical protein